MKRVEAPHTGRAAACNWAHVVCAMAHPGLVVTTGLGGFLESVQQLDGGQLSQGTGKVRESGVGGENANWREVGLPMFPPPPQVSCSFCQSKSGFMVLCAHSGCKRQLHSVCGRRGGSSHEATEPMCSVHAQQVGPVLCISPANTVIKYYTGCVRCGGGRPQAQVAAPSIITPYAPLPSA